MKTKDKFETIEVERPEAAIRRIVMNRPEARNARNLQMTYDLNAAFDAAVQDGDAGISSARSSRS
jgi:enoyl-CoA hydratase